ncbi:hypothetical protein J6Z19_06270 [bacterium]|nr:hypothetical protein [bacterium]
MGKNGNMKAFTIIELMVSIFLTILVVASFYKLYNIASREERSSAIRISINVAGEQMLDAISNAIRFIGLNGKLSDLDFYNSGTISSARPLIRIAEQDQFEFLSPYGGPVTKLAKDAEGTYPNCTFTLVSSTALSNKTKSFFFHNQDGIFETEEDEDLTVSISSSGELVFTNGSGFKNAPRNDLDGTECSAVFPYGTLVSGQDNFFMLKYNDATGQLKLCFTDKESMMTSADCINGFNEEKDTSVVNFMPDADKTYDMPTFFIQYLTETKSGNDLVVKWQNGTLGTSEGEDLRKDIVAVRFGFVLISERTRNEGNYPVNLNFSEEYCIFGDERYKTKDCYTLRDPNKTAYVFRRVVYLANHRLLKDFNN